MEQYKQQLTDLRNEFYDSLPKGAVTEWDMITWMKNMFKGFDEYIDAIPGPVVEDLFSLTPYAREQGITEDVQKRLLEKASVWNSEIKPHILKGLLNGWCMGYRAGKEQELKRVQEAQAGVWVDASIRKPTTKYIHYALKINGTYEGGFIEQIEQALSNNKEVFWLDPSLPVKEAPTDPEYPKALAYCKDNNCSLYDLVDAHFRYNEENSLTNDASKFIREVADKLKSKQPAQPSDIKEHTGFYTMAEYQAYTKGREDEEKVFLKFIEEWDGATNSAAGALLASKLPPKEQAVDPASFTEWVQKYWIPQLENKQIHSWLFFGPTEHEWFGKEYTTNQILHLYTKSIQR